MGAKGEGGTEGDGGREGREKDTSPKKNRPPLLSSLLLSSSAPFRLVNEMPGSPREDKDKDVCVKEEELVESPHKKRRTPTGCKAGGKVAAKQKAPVCEPRWVVPEAGIVAEFCTQRSVLLKQVAELCQACDVEVVPIGLSAGGIDIGASVPLQRVQLCVQLAPCAFSTLGLALEAGEDKVVVGVRAEELVAACRQIRSVDQQTTLQVHADLGVVSLLAGFDPRHRRRLKLRASPAQVVRVSVDEAAYASVQPITIQSASLTRALKPIRGAATTRVRLVGRASHWVAMFFENCTSSTCDVFLSQPDEPPPSEEDIQRGGDFSYTLMAAHIGKLLRIISLSPTVSLWVAPNMPIRFRVTIDGAYGTADLLVSLQPTESGAQPVAGPRADAGERAEQEAAD